MAYTFITVAHRRDMPLLRLQARSLGRYLAPECVHEFLVVGTDDGPLVERADYGRLGARVRLVAASEVASIPRGTIGWVSQQILKLAVARLVTSESYIVLDAKNHLVFPLGEGFFEDGGKLRSSRRDYREHPMRVRFERAVGYFGLDAECLVDSFVPPTTPFVFPTGLVRALIDAVVERERRPFSECFDGLGVTEFLLFGAYLSTLPGGIGAVYGATAAECPAVWPVTAPDAAEVRRVVARVDAERLPFFTVHRKAMPLLDRGSRELVSELWCRRGLFEDVGSGLEFLASCSAG
jgi:Family of unknown function (DUF6492)